MTKTIAVINQKGGVGKTATSSNLGHCLALSDFKTLLIDLEPSANTTKVFLPEIPEITIIDVLEDKDLDINTAIYPAKQREKDIKNLDIMPSRIQLATLDLNRRAHREKLLAKQLEKVKSKYDYIIIDCPPMLSPLSTIAVYAADFILMPVRYEKDALDGVDDLFDIIKDIKEDEPVEYKMLRNGLDNRKKKAIAYVQDTISPFLSQGLVFDTIISQDEEINKAKLEDETVLTFCPSSEGAKNYMELTKELLNNA